MMKKEEILETIAIILFAIFILLTLYFGTRRIDRINNGEMTWVNENQMDR